MAETQSYANHVRWDPGFHFTLMPVAAITEVMLVRNAMKASTFTAWWIALVGFAAIWMLLKMRIYSLTVQDRVIRLEERLRMMEVLPENQRSSVGELSRRQLVALRFAPDAELPGLVERCCKEKLSSKQIKEAIKDWRGDHFRV